MRDAAAAAAVGTTPVEIPGFDKCRSLRKSISDVRINCQVNINSRPASSHSEFA